MKQGGTPPPRSATSDKPYLSEKGSLRQKKKKVWVAKIEERVGYSFLLPYLLTLRRLCDRDLSLTPPELYGELWKDFATKEPNFLSRNSFSSSDCPSLAATRLIFLVSAIAIVSTVLHQQAPRTELNPLDIDPSTQLQSEWRPSTRACRREPTRRRQRR